MSFIEYLSLFLTFIGAIGSIVLIYEWVFLRYIKKNLTWKHVEKGVSETIRYLSSSNFQPHLVVCLGRGGCIFGGLIAGNLGVVRVCAVDRLKITSPEEAALLPDFFISPDLTSIAGNIGNKKLQVLLVAGEVVTGYDLLHATKHLQKKYSNVEIVSVSLTVLEHANYMPNYSYMPGLSSYHKPPWRMNQQYVNDRRANKLFHYITKST